VAEPIQIIANAVNAGIIVLPPSIPPSDGIDMLAEFVDDMSYEVGNPHDEEIVPACVVLMQKISGMAADGDTVFNRQPMTIADHDDIGGMSSWTVTIGGRDAVLSLNEEFNILEMR